MIRYVLPSDIKQLVVLCEEHAQYEKAKFINQNNASKLKQALFSKPSKLSCLVVENNDQLVGYATFMIQFSTWDSKEYFYLDCLYLREEYRGQGIGADLMQKVKDIALGQNCSSIQWQTPLFNKRAVQFYQRLGAESKEKIRFFWEL